MNGSFDEHVLQEISGSCVETKPRGIEATCIVSGNRGQLSLVPRLFVGETAWQLTPVQTVDFRYPGVGSTCVINVYHTCPVVPRALGTMVLFELLVLTYVQLL